MRHHPTAVPSAWPIAGGHVTVALVVGTLAHAGVARHVASLVRALEPGRHRVHLYVLSDAGEAADRLRALDVPVTLVPRRYSYEPGRVLALARAFARDGIDLVHAILPAGAAYGALAARLAGVSIVIMSSRAGDPHEDRHVRSVLHRLYRGATLVVANTRAQARLVAAETGIAVERVPVVYDGAELAGGTSPGLLDGLRDRVWHRPLVVGGAGSASAGRALFCAAAARIAVRHPDAQFVWLAEGHHADASVPADFPLTVVPVGDDPGPELRRLALLCLTDGPECPSLGLVPAAMAAARPVVAANVPGLDELIEDGATGAIVPAHDPAALAAAALVLLDDRGRLRSVGQAARARAERGLGVDIMARETARLYESSLLGAPTGPMETTLR